MSIILTFLESVVLSMNYDYGAWKRKLSGRRNRELTEAMVDALEAAISGARKSHIMLRAKLNSLKASQLIGQLITCGLLSREDPLYRTTERGLRLIDLFHEIESMLCVQGNLFAMQSPLVMKKTLSPLQVWR